MAPLSIMTAGINILTKSFGLFSTASLARCTCAITAATPFSTTAGGPPKRPLTGYMRFVKEQRLQVITQNPDVKAVEVIKQIAEQWRVLTPEQKRYKTIMERYQAQLTPAQSAAMVEEKRQKRAKRKAIRKKRELNTLGKPKRPRTGFNIFMAEHFEEAQGVTMQAKMKSLLEDWKNLYITQKQVYLQLAEDDKVRYKNEIKTWEEHMVDIGRQDLIRRKENTTRRTLTTKAGKKTAKSKVTKSKTAAKKTPAKKNTTATKGINKTVRTTKKA
ncbi:hypothetical protein AALO_G00275260 [Alosa alosa]|uniref:Transcription factor A, mitochondrial n=1 Tax=Alosa alosa TaxID=278164 RepID=A0AAV6FJ45_9TELE|nr:hypothetical protein AALO_G00275260 [Alosa alosa]